MNMSQTTNVFQVLIVTGIVTSEHDPRVSRMLARMLESTGRFKVRITEEFRGATQETLEPYDLLLINYDGKETVHHPAVPLGPSAESAIVNFVDRGKGLIFYHSSIFLEAWPRSFSTLIGGVFDFSQGSRKTPYLDFKVDIDLSHAITKELDVRLQVIQEDLFILAHWDEAAQVDVLATVYDDIQAYDKIPLHMQKEYAGKDLSQLHGIGTDVPVAWTNTYGKGRVFTVTIGHGPETIHRPGFVGLLCRGAEWAATGEVTLPPPDVSGENRFRAWPYYDGLTITEMAALI